jgi:hypothetical protein
MTHAQKRSRLLSFSPASERPTRTAGDDRVIAGADHAEHDDFGGLHRDLIATEPRWIGASYFALRPGLASASARCHSRLQEHGNVAELLERDRRRDEQRVQQVPRKRRPYPVTAQRPMVLNLSGVVRSDIRSSFAGLNGTATACR